MGMNLFDETDDTEDISKIETNKEYAKRFEHNKKREELQRFEELKKKGVAGDSEDEESSESEEEEGGEAVASDLKLFDALVKIRNKDPIINEKDKKLFGSESESEEGETIKKQKSKRKSKEKKKKPVYLKDVVGQEGSDGEEEEESEVRVKSYHEEQDEYRKALLDAAESVFEDEDGELLVEKKRSGKEEEEEDSEVEEKKKKLDEYFGEDDKLEENDKFLKKFFLDELWIDKAKERKPEDLYVLSEDEEEVDKQEKYEASYNFRFEEGVGDRVMGHSRFTEGSVRKKTNTRKLQRKSKEERMAQAEFERKEELKHMKNLKKKEIEEKLQKIRAIAGIGEDGVCALNEEDLEEEFDPEEYDRKMKKTFDEEYYDKGDVDPGFGSGGDDDLEKPDFDKEDELLGLPKDWDVGGDGFLAAREKILKRKKDNTGADTKVDNEEVEEELPVEGKRKRKRKIPLLEKIALDTELEEYYKLDYEDTIGDLKTRFKYTTVPSQRYGLNGEEMLMMDEKELNQYVPLKKLAPYREKEWKVPNAKRHSLKLKSKSLRKGTDLNDQKSLNKRSRKSDVQSTTEIDSADHGKTTQLVGSNGEVDAMSKRSKRRHRQADLKLSHSRLLAYGKIPSTSKNKKKH